MIKRYFLEYESDKFDNCMYNQETREYGSYIHYYGRASTIKTCKAYISKIKREHTSENPRKFKIYDSYVECAENEQFPCVYSKE